MRQVEEKLHGRQSTDFNEETFLLKEEGDRYGARAYCISTIGAGCISSVGNGGIQPTLCNHREKLCLSLKRLTLNPILRMVLTIPPTGSSCARTFIPCLIGVI